MPLGLAPLHDLGVPMSEQGETECFENGDVSTAQDLFKWLSKEVRDYMPGSVSVLDSPPTALVFSRDFVGANRPCVIRGAVDHWPAKDLWTTEFLANILGNTPISVNVTPTGLGDALCATEGFDVTFRGTDGKDEANFHANEKQYEPSSVPTEVFAQPEERRMSFSEFSNLLRQSSYNSNEDLSLRNRLLTSEIPYVSKQNDSFKTEFLEKLGPDIGNVDVVEGLSFATEAFGTPPDAVNLWIGSQNATTSFHRDHYENIYCVLRGSKTFTLLPPCDAWRMKTRKAPSARFEYTTKESETLRLTYPFERKARIFIDTPVTETTWPSVTPGSLTQDGGPAPFVVTVNAGETLYLPALWYHFVEQSDDLISQEPAMAVNFWHDMRFDDRFAVAKFLEAAAVRRGGV